MRMSDLSSGVCSSDLSRGSDDARLQGLNDALGQIQANPVFGNGSTVEHTYTIPNVYLQVLAAEGVFGFLGFVLMLAALVVPLRRATSPQRSAARRGGQECVSTGRSRWSPYHKK